MPPPCSKASEHHFEAKHGPWALLSRGPKIWQTHPEVRNNRIPPLFYMLNCRLPAQSQSSGLSAQQADRQKYSKGVTHPARLGVGKRSHQPRAVSVHFSTVVQLQHSSDWMTHRLLLPWYLKQYETHPIQNKTKSIEKLWDTGEEEKQVYRSFFFFLFFNSCMILLHQLSGRRKTEEECGNVK